MNQEKKINLHNHDHPWCIASIVYNILVILIEVIIIGVLNHMEWKELLSYEGRVQLFHLGGMILLGVVNYLWVHKYHHIKVGGFVSIAGIMLIAHILLLHILPRLIGIEMHHHEEHGHISETQEYMILLIVVTFVTLAFIFRDRILDTLKLKNKYQINLF